MVIGLAVVACDGSIAAPGDNKVVARGNLITTLWSLDGTTMTYAGAMKSQVVEKQKDSSLSTTYGPFRSLKLSTQDVDRRRLAVQPKALELSLRVMKAMYPAPDNSLRGQDTSKAIFRPSFRGESTTHWLSPDGRDIGFQMLTDKDKGLTAFLYVDGRAVVLAEFGYKRKSGRWKTTRMRSTFFDARGRPRQVVDTDLSDVQDVGTNVASSLMESSLKRASWLGSGFKTLALPDAAYAATRELPGQNCYQEWLLAITLDARAAYWASIALIAAAECPTPLFIITCPAAASALEQYAIALKEFKKAAEALAACRRANGNCLDEYRGTTEGFGLKLDCALPGETWPTSGDGSGGSIDCEWYTYEISYDGGETWEPYGDPFEICIDTTGLDDET